MLAKQTGGSSPRPWKRVKYVELQDKLKVVEYETRTLEQFLK
jgi:hypothetical protein